MGSGIPGSACPGPPGFGVNCPGAAGTQVDRQEERADPCAQGGDDRREHPSHEGSDKDTDELMNGWRYHHFMAERAAAPPVTSNARGTSFAVPACDRE